MNHSLKTACLLAGIAVAPIYPAALAYVEGRTLTLFREARNH